MNRGFAVAQLLRSAGSEYRLNLCDDRKCNLFRRFSAQVQTSWREEG